MSKFKTLRQQIADWCVHYRSPIHNECCSCGVNYRKMDNGPAFGVLARIPCVRNSPLTRQPVAECKLLQWPTEQEIDADVALWLQIIEGQLGAKLNQAKGGG